MVDEEYIIRKAIKVNGMLIQKIVAIEEMAELIKEICKDLRGIGSKENLIEEHADVDIVTRQTKRMYRISDADINKEIEYKLARLNARLGDWSD